MALVIEDGSGVAGATSYITVSQARAYATARGSALPSTDAEVEKLLIKAMDYLESFRTRYKGTKVTASQDLQWPRQDVYIDGYSFSSSSIPQPLKDAQAQLAIEANSSDLMPTGDGKPVVREKIDALETQYAQSVGGAPQPIFPKVDALLEPLLKRGGMMLGAYRA